MTLRVFYNDNGKLYAAEQPGAPSHAEMNLPTKDILKALTDSQPLTREEMLQKINHVDFNKAEAVLATEETSEKTSS